MKSPDLLNKLEELRNMKSENEIVEFKEAKNDYHFDKIGKYFSALSNEAALKSLANAWLVFGVHDKTHNIVGSSYRVDTRSLESLKKEIADKTTNRITFIDIHELTLPEGRVLMFQIPAAPKGIPVAWEGHYYGRDGESLSPLNLEEIERIRSQGTEKDWSAVISDEATLDDLSADAIQKARSAFKTKNPKLIDEIDGWDDLTFLNKAKVCIKGKITRAAIILLGKEESEHFISPATCKITWVLKDRDNIEKDYQHFSCPHILNTEAVYGKIRNLKYRYLTDGTLFPDEVDQYEPYIIREALNNCIAHQDYQIGGKVTVVEREDGFLTFSNSGTFIPKSINEVLFSDAPSLHYRNKFLADAMVNLNMIDTIGSGIKRMFMLQRKKYFPLPEYDLKPNEVKVTIFGKVLDMSYARKVATLPDLRLEEIILLDKVAKQHPLAAAEIKLLKSKGLIEGRKPNFHISATVAKVTGDRSAYIRQRGIDDDYCRKVIIDYLNEFDEGKKVDFERVLLDKLPDVLDEEQKKNKIKNILQQLKNNGIIHPDGKVWKMSKPA
ncbi:RNA-binding domain-containing protein [Trichlorobacter sp.]|uniref:RNA-binding domain-containing protein n=1 Tax=Trichlorobacter sp. TaxID=2911007 RepID=UPI002A35B874|nr:RNA-binding domain-containing protein [Trichlorobacter sp.]MDY0383816.1 putative DNA binding domain-containing protein [Trichlorobacter sp.]